MTCMEHRIARIYHSVATLVNDSSDWLRDRAGGTHLAAEHACYFRALTPSLESPAVGASSVGSFA
jgi:hypothetical protein